MREDRKEGMKMKERKEGKEEREEMCVWGRRRKNKKK